MDAGWRVILLGEAGQALTAWDGRGHRQHIEYDELLHPSALHQQTEDVQLTVERMSYGTVNAESANHLIPTQSNILTLINQPWKMQLSPLRAASKMKN
ncbi:hypothetical protein D3C76_1529380 [compost metagenome]